MELTPELKRQIDSKSGEELLRQVRFAPIGDPMMQGESGEYWLKRLSEVRDQCHVAYVAASKRIGW